MNRIIDYEKRIKMVHKSYENFVYRDERVESKLYDTFIRNTIHKHKKDDGCMGYYKLKEGFTTLKCKNTIKHINNHKLVIDYANTRIEDENDRKHFLWYYENNYNYPVYLQRLEDIKEMEERIMEERLKMINQ
jgi:hypothetical protein